MIENSREYEIAEAPLEVTVFKKCSNWMSGAHNHLKQWPGCPFVGNGLIKKRPIYALKYSDYKNFLETNTCNGHL